MKNKSTLSILFIFINFNINLFAMHYRKNAMKKITITTAPIIMAMNTQAQPTQRCHTSMDEDNCLCIICMILTTACIAPTNNFINKILASPKLPHNISEKDKTK